MPLRRLSFTLSAILTLTACSVLQGKPMPPPPPTEKAQLIGYGQTATLEKMGAISVSVRGSPDDADRAIQQQADARGARYYTITLKRENMLPGLWTSRAVLYR